MILWQKPYHHECGISIHKIGIGVEHDKDFVVDRPSGYGDDYIFLFFSSAIEILDHCGKRIEPPGSCIIYSPGTPQYYRATGKSFLHSWFHVTGEMAPRILVSSGLPYNVVEHLQVTSFVNNSLRSIFTEISNHTTDWQHAVGALLTLFCIELKRNFCNSNRLTIENNSAEMRVAAMRRFMQENCTRAWTIDSMARQASLSVSRFSSIYNKLFGTSPIDDVIVARLHKSCSLLFGSTVPIKVISQKCGFTDPAYFSRLFSKRIGMSPTKYSKREEWYFPNC